MKLQYFKNYKQFSVSELKQQYRDLSKKHHPDTTTGNDFEIINCYNTIYESLFVLDKTKLDLFML